jgi:hypothetical protein
VCRVWEQELKAVVDAKRLLDDLKRTLKRLEDDLRHRVASAEAMRVALQREYAAAKEGGRAGEAFEVWREAMLTQAAAAWLLSCVFVRFLEDNGLVDEALLSGPEERRDQASDRQMQYFQHHPTDSDRDYLYDVFRTVQTLPAVAGLFDESHNPIWVYGISGDAAKELIDFWRRRVPETGKLVHDFTDAAWNTRFLGDLYQDLSEEARKRYALLQTPEFVEEFILDRTLEPAIAEFGLKEVRLIDPTCGSGHFLLGAFQRILDRSLRAEPATPERVLVQRALDAVYGVDVNPYAVAIARFRLLLAALQASGLKKLKDAPGFHINVAVGDSLLHGRSFDQLDLDDRPGHMRRREGIGHAYHVEDLTELNRILGQQYHIVVGNPPYITVKDRALNQEYRNRFATCHRQYSLVVPFIERFFELAIYGHDAQPAGYVGMITANSFMKREFGKKLIEEFFPRTDLTHVIDTSGAYIPGHGTPTVILFGRDRSPVGQTVRAVLGIRGEPSTPVDPAQGQVWRSIIDLLDTRGAQNDFVSIADVPRGTFAKHPWSVSGGGAEIIKASLDNAGSQTLSEIGADIGFLVITGEDNCLLLEKDVPKRYGMSRIMPIGDGEDVRDWTCVTDLVVLWPNSVSGKRLDVSKLPEILKFLWPYRTSLKNRKAFGVPIEERGIPWWALRELYAERLKNPLSITFAFVATHNHFVLDRGGKVFNRSAPIIKLPADATEDDHLALLGLLNSSTACFWMKQVCAGKHKGDGGQAHADPAYQRFEFDGTKLQRFPLAVEKPLNFAIELDRLAQERQAHLPTQLATNFLLSRAALNEHKHQTEALLGKMIALQEELDWHCYTLYGITDQDPCYRDPVGNQSQPPELVLGQRAFEIVMARRIAAGELETSWFDRHGSKPITELPDHWPEGYKQLVEHRIGLIEADPYINVIERPEYKRRWNTEPWEEQERRALRNWLLDRLEDGRYWLDPSLQTTRTLANKAQMDADFLQVAELYRGHAGFDVHALVAELIESESVPFLPVLRYKPSGLRKREIWERTWELQRREDVIDTEVETTLTRRTDETAELFQERLTAEQRRRKRAEVGDIPPPPKYTSADFQISTYWRLRGALDVPKERFISYPFCSREADPSLLIGWAGWDYLQQAKAMAAWFTEVVEQEGWSVERLKPLLAGLAELIPWLKQWHNDLNPEFHERMGDFFEIFLQGQLQLYGLTRDDLRRWTPPTMGRAPGQRQRV